MQDAWQARARVTVTGDALPPDDLTARADSLATRISGHPAVAVVTHARMTTVVAVLAALRAGVPAVPVSADAGPREREHILGDSGASLLVDDGSITALVPSATAARIPAQAALVMYTSGTTGAPKGVPITQAAVDACLDGLYEAWDWTAEDTLVHGLPLHHVHGLVLGVLGPLRRGCPLVHTGRPSPTAYASAPGTVYFGVPTVWARIAQDAASARALSGARLLVSGSAALPASVFASLEALCGQAPVERYGMTETLITVAARADAPRAVGTVGRPLAGISTRVVGEDGTALPTGSVGELQVRGTSVFPGYLGQAERTSEAFADEGWFRTGDAATIDESGTHRIIGRLSTDLIKSGGYRIGAGEVEDCLLACPGVHETAVVGIDDADLGQRIVAFVVADDRDEARLIRHVAEQLSWHKRPREVVFVDELPRNAMGKVDKRALIASASLPPATSSGP